MSRATPLSYAPTGASFETDSFKLTNSYNRGFDAPHGPITSTSQDGGDAATWARYFGLPKKEIPRDPELDYRRENYDLPEAYHGKNLYLDLLIIYQVRLSQMAAITRMLPLKRWDKSISIQWDIWKFDDARLGRTPEESMSRLITSTFDTGNATFHRWGLAFMLEHGFMNTPRGRLNYRYNLVQIANATIETLCHGVIVALFGCSPMSFLSSQTMTSIGNDGQRWALFQEEIDQWACIHKRESPLVWLWDKLRAKILARTGEAADIFFVPFGTRGRVNRPEDAYYFLSGKPNNYSQGTQMPGTAVIESRDYKVGEGKDEDPAWQERTIGQHAYMLDKHLAGVKLCDFRTDMMDTALFCEDADDFTRISYKQSVFDTGMFIHNLRTDTWELSELGLAFFEDNTTVGDYLSSVGKLDTWANQLATCDRQRLLSFIAKFGGVEPEDGDMTDQDAVAGKFTATSRPTKGPFVQHDKGTHDDAVARLAGLKGGKKPSDPALSTRGVELMKKLYLLTQGQKHTTYTVPSKTGEREDKTDNEDEDKGDLPAGLALDPSLNAPGTGRGKAKKVDSFAIYNDNLKILAARDLSGDPNKAYALYWALYQLKRCLASDENDVNSIGSARQAVAKQVQAIFKNIDGAIDTKKLQAIYTAITAKTDGYPGASEYTICFNETAKIGGFGPLTRMTDVAIIPGQIVYYANPVSTAPSAEDRVLINLFNGLVDLAAPGGKDTRLMTAIGEAKGVDVKWAEVVKLANHRKSTETLQPIAQDFYDVIASQPNTDNLKTQLKKLISTAGATSSLERLKAKVAAVKEPEVKEPQSQVVGRFRADQKAQEQQRQEDGDTSELPIDMRDANKYTSIYKRTPAIRLLLGDDNMYLLYYRMVKANPRPRENKGTRVNPAWDDTNQHQTINDKQFVYYLSLVETMYQYDLEQAKGRGKDRARMERDAELRVIYVLQESAFQRMFKLTDFLEIKGHPNQWSGGLSVQSFLTEVSGGASGFNLREKVRTTQNVLLEALKAFSEEFLTEWHKNLPQDIRAELADRGVENIVRSGGSSIDILDQALQEIQNQNQEPNAPASGSGKDGKERSMSPEYIKEMLRNMPIIDGEWVRFGLENNLWPVIGIFLLKPYGTWVMGQAFAMLGGGRVGYTFEGHHDFQLQDNSIRKMHVGHWTLYAKPIVIRAEGVAHAYNISALRYVGGNGDTFWNIHNSNHVADYGEGKYFTASIFAVPVRINRAIPHWVYDITNRFNRYLGTTPEVCKERSLEIWAAAWGWIQDSSNPLERPAIPHDDVQQLNTIVFSANQQLYDHHTGRLDIYVRGRGHWGDREYPGCGEVRRGNGGYLRPRRDVTASMAIIT